MRRWMRWLLPIPPLAVCALCGCAAGFPDGNGGNGDGGPPDREDGATISGHVVSATDPSIPVGGARVYVPEPEVAASARALDQLVSFVSTRGGDLGYEVYTMTSAGEDVRRLTNAEGNDAYPDLSADGRQVAFTSERDGNAEVYVMPSDGDDTSAQRLTDDPGADVHPAWSHDGTRIAFASDRGGNYDIYVMDADGTGVTQLTTDPANDAYPDWSPDDSQIAFTSLRDGNHEIYVMNADGSGQTNLTGNAARDSAPCWSPDGARIAFASDRDPTGVYTMAADGADVRRIADGGGRPSWSSDGEQIAFVVAADTNMDICLVSATGGIARNLTEANLSPDWWPSLSVVPEAPPPANAVTWTTAGSDGAFVLNEVPPGPVTLIVEPPAGSDYAPASIALRVGARSEMTVQVTLVPTALAGSISVVNVTPHELAADPRAGQQFSAEALTDDGQVLSLTPTWLATDWVGVITPEGLFTAGLGGSGSVQAVLAGRSGSATVSVQGASPIWPMSGRDPSHTARSPYLAAQAPTERWSLDVGAAITAGPVIDSEGTVYVGTSVGQVLAIGGSGDVVSEHDVYGVVTGLAIGPDGAVYVATSTLIEGAFIYAFSPDWALRWAFVGDQTSALALDPSGVVYAQTGPGKLGALGREGTRAWAFPTAAWLLGRPAIGTDGTVYMSADDGNLYAISADGARLWALSIGSQFPPGDPAVGADGTIYAAGSGGRLLATGPDGAEAWAFETGAGWLSPPAVGPDGVVYVSADDGSLYAVGPDGAQRWAFPTEAGLLSGPAIGVDGTAYVGGDDGTVYAASPDGTPKWTFATGGAVGSLAIGEDGTVYVATPTGSVHAIGGEQGSGDVVISGRLKGGSR